MFITCHVSLYAIMLFEYFRVNIEPLGNLFWGNYKITHQNIDDKQGKFRYSLLKKLCSDSV